MRGCGRAGTQNDRLGELLSARLGARKAARAEACGRDRRPPGVGPGRDRAVRLGEEQAAAVYIVMACIVMAYIVMAYVAMALYSYGLYCYGLYSYGLYSHGLYRHDLCSNALCSYGLYSHGEVVIPADPTEERGIAMPMAAYAPMHVCVHTSMHKAHFYSHGCTSACMHFFSKTSGQAFIIHCCPHVLTQLDTHVRT